MNSENSTGKPARLPLHERARRGLLLSEPELSTSELAWLEHPTDTAARKAYAAALNTAIQYGDLPARREIRTLITRKPAIRFHIGGWRLAADDPLPKQVTEHRHTVLWLDREAYRRWRAQCLPALLSPLSQARKWLGDEAALPDEPATGGAGRRDDALTIAIRAALAALNPAGGPLPTARALFDYLRTSDKTGVIVDSGKDSLTWFAAETGRKQLATVANLKKRLDRWKD